MKKLVLRKGATIQITARRWFDKTAGNTYHAVHIYVKNGNIEHFLVSPPTYGYGESYMDTAFSIIWRRFQACKDAKSAGYGEVPYRYAWQLKEWYKISETVTDVARKKDLAF